MSNILEFAMMIFFGISWPISLIKNIKAKSVKGVSLLFYLMICGGYVMGILAKLTNETYMNHLSENWFVLACYIFNFTIVIANVVVYFINKKRT